ncbi:hypothetical protein [Bradyrhizobium sp. AC87j1]|uniref:hypothetical protein n=1 Tax=Bradyrhizobium sp. AC87j1 TaxID=2055894 RepID=UPI0011B04785|nr:hypothetical protein [Bradyrhizobium sp. AC87j1]
MVLEHGDGAGSSGRAKGTLALQLTKPMTICTGRNDLGTICEKLGYLPDERAALQISGLTEEFAQELVNLR